MCTHATTTVFLRVCALGFALASSPALAQDAAPAAAGQAPTQPTATGTPSTETAATEAAQPTEAAPPASSAGPTAIGRSLAVWVQAVGARICTGPHLVYGDRVCLPDLGGTGRGWRFSVPSFAEARVSTPPARAHDAQAADPGTTTPTEPTEPVATASEPAGN
jgi:hypothetical protein